LTGGFDGGFEAAGMRCRWQVEINDACNRVLERHWPEVRKYRDIKEVDGCQLEPVEIICAGFPCQDLSIAGKRNGLKGERSGLFFEVVRIIREMREKTNGLYPAFLVLENVPGLLSSNGGRDFTVVLREMAKSGAMDIAWAVLDAQWFGVAQRRRRVFIVADFRGERAGEILFIPYGSKRHSPPGREKKSLSASLLASGAGTSRPAGIGSEADFLVTQALTGGFGKGGPDDNLAQGNFLIPETAKAVNTSTQRMDGTVETFVIQDAAMPRDKKKNGIGITAGGPCYTLDGHGAHAVAHTLRAEGYDASEDGTGRGTSMYYESGPGFISEGAGCLRAEGENRPSRPAHLVIQSEHPYYAVRRLTPLEAERLQGFEDGWTAGESDAARYKMLGNAVCRNVAEWIGKRIVEAD
jgi:DNA (cytosine-5)-methyltransferase 1